MKIEFEGLEELIGSLEKMETDTKAAQDEAVLKAAEVMKEATEERAPILSGNLKTHVRISDIKNGEVDVYIDQQGKGYYGYFHEFGTSKMPARPFMGPAFNASRFKMEQTMVKALRARMGLMS